MTNNWFGKMIKNVILSPVNVIFAIATAYFAAQAYLWEPTFMNKIIFFAIAGLWAFWIVARYMIVLFVIAALLAGGYYAYYRYSTREIRKCEAEGGEWNKETKTCEAKLSFGDKIINRVNKMISDFFQPQEKPAESPAATDEQTPSSSD